MLLKTIKIIKKGTSKPVKIFVSVDKLAEIQKNLITPANKPEAKAKLTKVLLT